MARIEGSLQEIEEDVKKRAEGASRESSVMSVALTPCCFYPTARFTLGICMDGEFDRRRSV